MNLYYFANQIYQFSYALPIYRDVGGVFITKSMKRIMQFKYYLRGTNSQANVKTWLNTPSITSRSTKEVRNLSGIVISLSNAAIHSDAKKNITIFIGHGTGDKPYGPNDHYLKSYDYHFTSGPKHLEKLRDLNIDIPEKKLIKIGNVRFDDYINNKINLEREYDRLGIVDRTRQNVLYAPTWKWGNGTLHRYGHLFARELTKQYNLIIRPHHHDRKYIFRMKLWAKMNGIDHVYFSNPADLAHSDTMNDFAVSDIMISDTSSILYEYLITQKPIIVAQTDYKELHHMPNQMNIMNYTTIFNGKQDILKLVEKSLSEQKFKHDYQNLLHNCLYFNDGKSVERAAKFLESIS